MNDQDERCEDPDADLGETMDGANSTVGGDSFSLTVNQGEGQAEAAHRQLDAGDRLGKYEIKRKLGQGGMAAVYLAFDPLIEREVAIKVLPPEVANQPTALERFLSEARATGKLNHTNVVSIFDIDREGDFYYIVMELVRGGSVAEFIANRDRNDWVQSCRIMIEACEGLAAAHAAGLIHRDIKPENLMLTDQGVVKVVDFGLAKLVDATAEAQLAITGAGQFVGTPHYMSPEQFDAADLDARSDVYAMGATLFTVLTSQPPFSHAKNLISLMTAHAAKPPPDPTELNDEIPAACSQIIAKAMAKNPDDRYRNAGEMAAALRELISDDPARAPVPLAKPLQAALIVEPSKMQAMMFSRGLQSAGVDNVAVCSGSTEAMEQLRDHACDLVITAMELTGESGIDLLFQLRQDARLRDTVVVVNASDPDVRSLTERELAEPCAVAAKKIKPAELLRSIDALTYLTTDHVGSVVDATTLRLVLVGDSARVPDPMAVLLRESALLDVHVTTFETLARDQAPADIDIVMELRTAGDAAHDTNLYVESLSKLDLDVPVSAALQVDGDRITLRALRRGEFVGVARSPLDQGRFQQLLQLCR